MKLEVGMFVKYTRGAINGYVPPRIARTVDCSDNELIKIDNGQVILRSDVIKARHKIIDLIEVGDYVNGLRINSITEVDENHDVRLVWNLTTYGDDDISFSNEEIKSIVTKEQFESMKYEVDRW
jgi:hypothetical protein